MRREIDEIKRGNELIRLLGLENKQLRKGKW